MTPYLDYDQNSSVQGFQVGEGWIDGLFKDGSLYRYTAASAGAQNIEIMARHAYAGQGLGGFINRNVGRRYAARLR